MLKKSTIQLLRFHFSLFLLPVYLFALSQLITIDWYAALLVFVVLHLLVYPASNGYNSFMDKDTDSIGGIEKPLMPTRQLFYVTVLFDVLAIMISLIVSAKMAAGVLLYILASRAYSYRGIRLKKYAVLGFLTVAVCQGALVFWIAYTSCGPATKLPLLGMLASSCLIASYYPLTQIYQHQQDAEDGVQTISMLVGKRGSFILSGVLFAIAATSIALLSYIQQQPGKFYLFLLMMLPVLIFFMNWMYKVWKDESSADFKQSLQMNVVASSCTSFYFITIILMNNF